jgi:xanthosine utilization system XapX-like protein
MRKTQKEMRFSQCIALIDGLLVGLLYIWDIPLDAASFIALTMAIGLSVGAETVFSVRPLSVVTRSVYQDRLGTNIK